jgi:hypothetical protein
MSTVQLAILLDDETLKARNLWTAINFLRALRDGSPGMLWKCARQFNFRHANQKSRMETLTNSDFRACARLIADAVPEILYFLPWEEARDFVYLLCSCDIAERDGDPKLVVTIAPEELKAQLLPLMVGMRAAIVKAKFPEEEPIRQSINVLECLQVSSAQRGDFLP